MKQAILFNLASLLIVVDIILKFILKLRFPTEVDNSCKKCHDSGFILKMDIKCQGWRSVIKPAFNDRAKPANRAATP